jgi:hypothetical protein
VKDETIKVEEALSVELIKPEGRVAMCRIILHTAGYDKKTVAQLHKAMKEMLVRVKTDCDAGVDADGGV